MSTDVQTPLSELKSLMKKRESVGFFDLPDSGQISIGDIMAEYGLTGQTSMNECSTAAGLPVSTQRRLSDFYGLSAVPTPPPHHLYVNPETYDYTVTRYIGYTDPAPGVPPGSGGIGTYWYGSFGSTGEKVWAIASVRDQNTGVASFPLIQNENFQPTGTLTGDAELHIINDTTGEYVMFPIYFNITAYYPRAPATNETITAWIEDNSAPGTGWQVWMTAVGG